MDPESSDAASFSGLRTDPAHAFVCGLKAELHSDFTHTGAVDHSDAERTERHRRTGSILLPLFRGSERIGAYYLTMVDVLPSAPGDLQADERAVLQFVHPDDRTRVYGYRAESGTLRTVLGNALREAEVPKPIRNGRRFGMCAATLPGDPRVPDAGGRPSPVDASDSVRPGEIWMRLRHQQNGADQPEKDDLALFQMAPLLLQSDLAPARRLYVVTSIANHNFVYDAMEACWDAFGAEGAFSREYGRKFPGSTPERRRICASAVAVAESGDQGRTLRPVLSPDKMYLISGLQYSVSVGKNIYTDYWIQDEVETGYCRAPGGRAFNVVLHCKRESLDSETEVPPLSTFVTQEMAAPDEQVFLFDGLSAQVSGSSYSGGDDGGNIAVSPPVRAETPSQDAGRAGPRVPAHPPAPHGKIILGDCFNRNRSDSFGLVHKQTRRFLQAQQVQPIVPINTSWLSVGHVDEIMAFVPSRDGPRLAMARPDVMRMLLTETEQVDVKEGRTHFHRGRHTEHFEKIEDIIDQLSDGMGFARSYDETSVEQIRREYALPNKKICNRFLNPIQHRLCHCTGLSREDVLPLPVYFCYANDAQRTAPWGRKRAESRTPNVVNMQPLNTGRVTHLLVPRPCGPRLPPEDAEPIVRSVLNAFGQNGIPVHLPQDKNNGRRGFPFWAWPNLKTRELALFFTRTKRTKRGNPAFIDRDGRAKMIEVLRREKAFDALPRTLQQAVQTTRTDILDANNLPPDLETLPEWHRLFIPEDTVDVVEAYTASVLRETGCTVHFVDAWFYHTGGGGVHCGTNLLHKVPSADSPEHPAHPSWWDTYPTLATADTRYDPLEMAQ